MSDAWWCKCRLQSAGEAEWTVARLIAADFPQQESESGRLNLLHAGWWAGAELVDLQQTQLHKRKLYLRWSSSFYGNQCRQYLRVAIQEGRGLLVNKVPFKEALG